MTPNPFPQRNGRLPAQAHAEERHAAAAVDEAGRKLSAMDAEIAKLEQFHSECVERVATAEMKASADSHVAVSEALSKRSTDITFLKRLRTVFGTVNDTEALKLVTTAAPAQIDRLRARQAHPRLASMVLRDLRTAANTAMREAGTDAAIAAKSLGHSTEMNSRSYVEATDEAARRAIMAL